MEMEKNKENWMNDWFIQTKPKQVSNAHPGNKVLEEPTYSKLFKEYIAYQKRLLNKFN